MDRDRCKSGTRRISSKTGLITLGFLLSFKSIRGGMLALTVPSSALQQKGKNEIDMITSVYPWVYYSTVKLNKMRRNQSTETPELGTKRNINKHASHMRTFFELEISLLKYFEYNFTFLADGQGQWRKNSGNVFPYLIIHGMQLNGKGGENLHAVNSCRQRSINWKYGYFKHQWKLLYISLEILVLHQEENIMIYLKFFFKYPT